MHLSRSVGSRSLLALGSALSLAALAGSAAGGQGEEFSRSAWIADNMDRVEFSGGVIPNGDWQGPEPGQQLVAEAKIRARRTRKPRRVNGDLLLDEAHQQAGTQAEPYLHVNPQDAKHLVAGWQENRYADGGAQALNVAVSFDRGKSWSESILPGLTLVGGGPWQRASDPWVEFGPDGRVFFASLLFNETSPDNAIGVSRSTDGGRTWADPVEVFGSPIDFNDKEALTVDTFPESPHFGNIYVAWDINIADVTGQSVVAQDLVVARSTDGGETFQRRRRLRRGPTNIGAVPRVGPNGTVYVVWSGRRGNDEVLYLYFSRSRNGGRRWSRPRVIARLAAVGIPDIRSGDILPSFAVDPVTGELYIVWQDARWSGVDQITFTASRDGGRSWSEPRLVSAAPPDAPTFTTSVAVNATGQVAVSYYSLQNDPQRSFLVDRYLRLSNDGGQSFGRAIRATRQSFDIRFAAVAQGFFLGDYVGLAGAASQFHLLWVDTRRYSSALDTRQPDVWTARTR